MERCEKCGSELSLDINRDAWCIPCLQEIVRQRVKDCVNYEALNDVDTVIWKQPVLHNRVKESTVKTHYKTITELLENKEDSPLPLAVIPNYMGINLCSVEGIEWQRQEDGQLVNLTIHFIPEEPK